MKMFLKISYLCKKYNISNMYVLLEFLKKNSNLSDYIIELLKLDTIVNNDSNNITFIDILNKIYILFLQNIQDNLIIKEKKIGLNIEEKKKIMLLNNKLIFLHKKYKMN